MATKKSKQVLGVMITGRAVHAVLLDDTPEGLQVVRRFMRQRTSRFSSAQTALPELQNTDEQDFSVQFTDTGSNTAENMFLGSEFGTLEAGAFEAPDEKSQMAATFALELGDILAECRDAGHPDPLLAFCAGAAEVNQVELIVPAKSVRTPDVEDKRKKPIGRGSSRGSLLDLLGNQHKGEIVEECVAFLPMTHTDEGGRRYLAVFPKANDAVAGTIRTMREQNSRRLPPVRLLDTEVPLYMGMARAALGLSAKPSSADAASHTLIVRAGAEDTLVLFLEDGTLRQSENLRSLTAYEAPETICSRVLLLQDEYGIGDVQHVLLLSEEREDDLIESFEMFFPDARVESMRQYVPEMEDRNSAAVPAGALLPAVGVGLRLLDDERYRNVFEDVNLLPKQLLRRRITLPVTWHVLALYVLLFCTVLFFMARYFTLENKIDDYQRSVREFEAEVGPVDTDARQLQAKIDSLQAVHTRYMRSLNVLEDLLKGSDKWSRTLEKSSDQVSQVTGIWIESWTPRGNNLELKGNATSRDHVVDLATRMGGTIATLTFSEIRDWPVYSFQMSMPLPNDLPVAAKFLREQVATAEAEAAENVPVTSTSLQ